MKSKYQGPYIIAEIGINHNGDMDIAKKLIDIAVEAKCDAVKFQKRTIDLVYSEKMLSGKRDSPWGTTQREQKEGLEFGLGQYREIEDYCKNKEISWSASSWDLESQKFLQKFNLPFNKIASAMITYEPLLKMVAEEQKHTIISTGMTTYENIDKAVNIFKNKDCPFTLLHCVSTYPCEDEECDINVLETLKNKYECQVGYSGHEKGILPTVASAVLGAQVIERHITIDRTMYGSDQSASLEKKGLIQMVNYCRSLKSIMGDGVKKYGSKEMDIASKLRHFEN
tara:strand:- start:1537 stop:2385 length:849 start_codon:yes stop_codon:yes gene_type:complete